MRGIANGDIIAADLLNAIGNFQSGAASDVACVPSVRASPTSTALRPAATAGNNFLDTSQAFRASKRCASAIPSNIGDRYSGGTTRAARSTAANRL